MIKPARYDITIPQRATFRQPLRLKAAGVPLNATGYELVRLSNAATTQEVGDIVEGAMQP